MAISSSPRVSLAPYPRVHLSHYFERSARLWPGKVALIDSVSAAEYTFHDSWMAASRLARRLQDDGIGKDDRVAIFAPNSPEYVIAFHAILLAGATVTTLNPLYREREVGHQLGDSSPKAIFVTAAALPVVESVWSDGKVYNLEEAWQLAADAAGEHKPVSFDPVNDIAVLPYSSGTTGGPKGVMLTHFSVASNIRQTLASGLIDNFGILIDFLPFYHIYGMVVLMNAGLAAGATQVIMPRFDPQAFFELIARYKATNLFVAPPVMLALANLPAEAKVDFSSVRFVLSGAAPLAPDIARRVAERYGVTVLQGYGMTEASPVTHISLIGRDKLGSVGVLVSDTTQRVVDLDSGVDLGVGEVGELLVEGPQVMKGYWNNEQASAECLIIEDPAKPLDRGDGIKSDDPFALRSDAGPGDPLQLPRASESWRGRWLRTGDIVSMDEEGYITVHDRAKEMIKYKGYQIAPAELEALLIEHPAIVDAAVIPKADEEGGEAPKAYVVIKEGANLSAEEVQAFVAERVAPYKKVREVEFIDAIPKNPSGKILRRELIEKERARAPQV